MELTQEGHAIVDICATVGISKETYFQWKNNKPDFSDQLKAAETRMWEIRRRSMNSSLDKLINGYEVDYVETTAEQDGFQADGTTPKYRVVSQTKKKKIFSPNAAIVTKMLEALEPERFTDKKILEVDHTVSNTKFSIKRRVPPAELPPGTVTILPAPEEPKEQTDENYPSGD